LVDSVTLNGVAVSGAGFEDIGTTVTVVGAVPAKFSFTEGKATDAGITASVTPLEKVATFELVTSPAVMAAVFELGELDELELLTSGTEFEGLEKLDAPIALIARTRKV
jgi:hypothetical protein